MDYRIISIGALSSHELWEKPAPPRTPHATTTLVRSGDATILVDPGLPGEAIVARLQERSGLTPDDITHVFLTSFRPCHRWGLTAFPDATWLISEAERESMGVALIERFDAEDADDEIRAAVRRDIELLQKCKNAPDKIATGVDLFPMPGFTPGTCGLLLSQPTRTVLIAGDAVPTAEHLEQGRVLRGAFDIEKAQDSLMEAIEIADIIVPGHDNWVLNPGRRSF